MAATLRAREPSNIERNSIKGQLLQVPKRANMLYLTNTHLLRLEVLVDDVHREVQCFLYQFKAKMYIYSPIHEDCSHLLTNLALPLKPYKTFLLSEEFCQSQFLNIRCNRRILNWQQQQQQQRVKTAVAVVK